MHKPIEKDNYKLLISIIMPSFNSELFISQSIKSVIEQSYKNWELLIVDGMSSDTTRELIKDIQLKESRIRLIDNPDDNGPGQARNFGLKKIRGQYIAFIDSDDLWHPNKLNIQLKNMIKNDYVFTYTNYKVIDENNNISKAYMGGHKSNNFYQYLRRRGIANSSVIIKTDIITNNIFDEVENMYAEDTMWWLLLLKNGHTSHSLNQTLMFYRSISNSRSSNIFQNQRDVWKFYKYFLNLGLFWSLSFYILYLFDVIKRRVKFKITNFILIIIKK